jgi:hypothetical protein
MVHGMSEPPLTTLARWEHHGGVWRTVSLVVELCACHGERVDGLRSGDSELIRYLADRRSSEDPPSQ